MSDQYVVEAEQIVKAYDGVKAVDGISFGISAGAIYGLLGPNGAGTVSYTHLTLPTILLV